MRFFPLSMARMGGDGVCVAGVDADTRQWIRPVVASYRCLFRAQAGEFEWNRYHEFTIGGRQVRGLGEDPDRRHSEDRILRGSVARGEGISPADKLALLQQLAEPDLRKALSAGGRSLFLVEPFEFRCDPYQDGSYRWEFSAAGTSIAALRQELETSGSRMGVSGRGCKCTCPFGNEFAAGVFAGRPIGDLDIRRLPGSPRLFLTLSLSALKYEKYWLIVAGVHIVGGDRTWL